MEALQITKAPIPKTKPDDNALGFGQLFTDHMFVMDYSTEKGWYSPRIEPYGPFLLEPSTMVFHYGQAIFEGMKAYRNAAGEIVLFRPKDYLARMNRSAAQVCIPEIDEAFILDCLKELLRLERDWVPSSHGTSLYIRPFIISTDPYLGVRPSHTYKFFIILSPVGAYYPEGLKPVKIYVEDYYVRAVPGGLGEAKTAANYAASLRAAEEAKAKGYTQVLWLDGCDKKYIEEVGTMNIFFKINGEIITPPLGGSVLGGMTRFSVIEMAKYWGMPVKEYRLSIDEVYDHHAKGTLEEVFGSGTAAVVSPVSELNWKDKNIVINNGEAGETSLKLYKALTDIQYGLADDPFGWVDGIE